jgi:hypothetical protein
VNQLDRALNAGSTLQEVSPYLDVDTDDLIAEDVAGNSYIEAMVDKYDLPIYKAMFNPDWHDADGTPLFDQDLRMQSTFKYFSQAHRAILKRYIRHIRREWNLNETAKVAALDYVIDTRSDGTYSSIINVQLTNDVDDGDMTRRYYSIEGEILTGVNPAGEDGFFRTLLGGQPEFRGPFRDLEYLD